MDNTKLQQSEEILDSMMSGKLSVELSEDIREWIAEDQNRETKHEALRRQFDKQVRFTTRPSKYAYRMLDDNYRRLGIIGRHIRAPFWRVAMQVAVVLMPFAIIAGGVFWLVEGAEETIEPPKTAQTEIIVQDGDPNYIELPDGSRVWIREGTQLTYAGDFEHNRHVVLTGEAYFSVVSNPDYPFTVTGSGVTVKVTGTEFNVRAYKTDTAAQVTLISGTVEVTTRTDTHILAPKDQFLYDLITHEVTLRRVSDSELSKMKDGMLSFDNTPLEEVLHQIAQVYELDIQIEGEFDRSNTIRMKFNQNDSLEDILYAIQHVSGKPFDYRIDGSQILITVR